MGTSVELVRTTSSDVRIVHEISIELANVHGPIKRHNFAVVADLEQDRVLRARVYYGYNNITGGHEFSRPAMLPHDPTVFDGLAPPVKQYLASIANGWTEVYRMFTEDGCFAHFCGPSLPRFFVVAMHTGPVPIKPTTATCDSSACAVEENLDSWGNPFSINTGGLAVFEFTEEGRISRMRVYDDISDVAFLETGWFAENWEALSEGFESVGCPAGKCTTRR